MKRFFSSQLNVHQNTATNNASIPFKFTPENAKLASTILSKYPKQYAKAAVIPLLDLGQRQLGFCSLSVMNHVAQVLDMPKMRVYEVATFYTMFNRQPVGKYFLQVCTTTPCELRGAYKIVSKISEILGIHVGETTEDGLFTLVEVECAGACVNAPVVAVNDDYFEDVDFESITRIIENLKKDKVLKAGPQLKGEFKRGSCEPYGEATSLIQEPPGPGYGFRSDFDLPSK